MRVIVTRPLPQALHWRNAFTAQGLEVCTWPLIEVRANTQQKKLQRIWAQALAQGYTDIMFVSATAVRMFFAVRPPAPPLIELAQALPRTWATGAGTAAALRGVGVPPERIDTPADYAPQWDSENLWAKVAPRVGPHSCVLIVRGLDAHTPTAPAANTSARWHALATSTTGHGRDWLGHRIRANGGQVEFIAVYRRHAPAWSSAQRDAAGQALADGSVWLFTSALAITHLRALLPGSDWAGARALVTHPRIALVAQAHGFGQVHTSGPQLDAVIASIKSLG